MATVLNAPSYSLKEFRILPGYTPADSSAPHQDLSLFAAAYCADIPATVHVALGTDTPFPHIVPGFHQIRNQKCESYGRRWKLSVSVGVDQEYFHSMHEGLRTVVWVEEIIWRLWRLS